MSGAPGGSGTLLLSFSEPEGKPRRVAAGANRAQTRQRADAGAVRASAGRLCPVWETRLPAADRLPQRSASPDWPGPSLPVHCGSCCLLPAFGLGFSAFGSYISHQPLPAAPGGRACSSGCFTVWAARPISTQRGRALGADWSIRTTRAPFEIR